MYIVLDYRQPNAKACSTRLARRLYSFARGSPPLGKGPSHFLPRKYAINCGQQPRIPPSANDPPFFNLPLLVVLTSNRSDPKKVCVSPSSLSTTIHGNPNAPSATSCSDSALSAALFSSEVLSLMYWATLF